MNTKAGQDSTQTGSDPLTRNDSLYKALMNAATDGIILIDESGRIESFNHAAEQLFGYQASEVIGCDVSMLMPGTYQQEHSKYLRNYLQTGERHIIGIGREVEAITRNGRIFPIELAVGEARFDDERVFVGLIRDITERKRSEVQIRESESRFRTLFEQAPIGSLLIDPSTDIILDCNDYIADLLGYTHEQLSGLHLSRIELDYGSEKSRIHRRNALDGSNDYFETVLLTHDGERRDIILSMTPVHFGGRTLLYASQLDITEQNRTSAELIEKQRELTLASRLSVLGEMTAGIAHELNQPMTAISVNAQAARRLLSDTDDKMTDIINALSEIESQALRAGDVIKSLHTFARTGHSEKIPVSPSRLLHEAVNLATHELEQHDMHIKMQIDPDLPDVLIDVIQIQQVILNLLHNSIEAMTSPEVVTRCINLKVFKSGESELLIEVADRGQGLKQDSLTQMFLPFYTTKPMGMGIGLALSRSIIDAHGGTISYRPNPGGGAIFSFTLPID